MSTDRATPEDGRTFEEKVADIRSDESLSIEVREIAAVLHEAIKEGRI